LGSVYEFHNTKQYDFPLIQRQSSYTDDTVLTIAVARWLMSDRLTDDNLEENLVGLTRKYRNPCGGYGESYSLWAMYIPDGQRHPYNSWGNGSAMRVSAVGWMYDTLEETESVAAKSAAITHNHPEGIKGAQATAAVIWLARHGKTKEEIRNYVESRFGYDLSSTWEEYHRTYGWDVSCQGTVPPAIVCFLESAEFVDAIRKAVSIGGDSDTLACITGGMAEAYYKEIPEELVRDVWNRLPEEFQKTVKEFASRTAYGEMAKDYLPKGTQQEKRITPERITELEPNQFFVFGSNLAGQHGGGAARLAFEKFGAIWGQGVGLQGQSYAIPTMQGGVETIKPYVDEFIAFAKQHPEMYFYVTRIGCGIAGFRDSEIAPLFAEARQVDNIALPESFWN